MKITNCLLLILLSSASPSLAQDNRVTEEFVHRPRLVVGECRALATHSPAVRVIASAPRKSEPKGSAPAVAAVPYGKGRVMVISGTRFATASNDRFIADALLWVNGGKPVFCKKGLAVVGTDVAPFFDAADEWADATDMGTLRQYLRWRGNRTQQMPQFAHTFAPDLLYLSANDLHKQGAGFTDEVIPLLRKFVEDGGGLIVTGVLPDAYGSDKFAGNLLLEPMGIRFTAEELETQNGDIILSQKQ